MATPKTQFTAVYQKRGKSYIGFVEEVSGANTQGKNLAEVKKNLAEALKMVVEANREIARKTAKGFSVREPIFLPA